MTLHASGRRRQRQRAMHTRVWVRDVEVTNRCYFLDGRRRIVRLFKHRDGHPFVEWESGEPGLAREEIRCKPGQLRWRTAA